MKWVGYPLEVSTWEPLENVGHLKEEIADLKRRMPEKFERDRKTWKRREEEDE